MFSSLRMIINQMHVPPNNPPPPHWSPYLSFQGWSSDTSLGRPASPAGGLTCAFLLYLNSQGHLSHCLLLSWYTSLSLPTLCFLKLRSKIFNIQSTPSPHIAYFEDYSQDPRPDLLTFLWSLLVLPSPIWKLLQVSGAVHLSRFLGKIERER